MLAICRGGKKKTGGVKMLLEVERIEELKERIATIRGHL